MKQFSIALYLMQKEQAFEIENGKNDTFESFPGMKQIFVYTEVKNMPFL